METAVAPRSSAPTHAAADLEGLAPVAHHNATMNHIHGLALPPSRNSTPQPPKDLDGHAPPRQQQVQQPPHKQGVFDDHSHHVGGGYDPYDQQHHDYAKPSDYSAAASRLQDEVGGGHLVSHGSIPPTQEGLPGVPPAHAPGQATAHYAAPGESSPVPHPQDLASTARRSSRLLRKESLPTGPVRAAEGRVRKRSSNANHNTSAKAAPKSRAKTRPVDEDEAAEQLINKPLSALERTLDLEKLNIKLVDIEAIANRSVEQRKDEVERGKTPGKIGRPMNVFLLYRKKYHPLAKYVCNKANHQELSRACGQSWRLESPEVHAWFTRLAEVERDLHKETWPTYRFLPTKPPTMTTKRKASTQDGDDSGDYPAGRATKRTRRGGSRAPVAAASYAPRGMSPPIDLAAVRPTAQPYYPNAAQSTQATGMHAGVHGPYAYPQPDFPPGGQQSFADFQQDQHQLTPYGTTIYLQQPSPPQSFFRNTSPGPHAGGHFQGDHNAYAWQEGYAAAHQAQYSLPYPLQLQQQFQPQYQHPLHSQQPPQQQPTPQQPPPMAIDPSLDSVVHSGLKADADILPSGAADAAYGSGPVVYRQDNEVATPGDAAVGKPATPEGVVYPYSGDVLAGDETMLLAADALEANSEWTVNQTSPEHWALENVEG